MRATGERRRGWRHWQSVLAALLAFACTAASAGISLIDDAGRSVILHRPAQRIISLTPHLTELLFAAGAGERIVGTVEYSNYPQAAQRIARIGNNARLDLERIVALKPDLIVVWKDGNAQRQLDKLLTLGIPVFYNQPRRLPDIARAIEQLGQLAGTEARSLPAARDFVARLADLRRRYAGRGPVSVYFQIWDKPLLTINGEHMISDVIRLCGGRNIFAGLKALTPQISIEAVLAADPQAIVGASGERGQEASLAAWRAWPRLRAVANGKLFLIDADVISRNTPRIIAGAEQMCAHLDTVRPGRR